jgi:hypothetical protein
MNILGALLLICAMSGQASADFPRPTGAFIQISPPWYKRRIYDWQEGTLAQKKQCCLNLWRREFENLSRIGIKTVVVQFTVTAESALNKLCFDPGGQVTIGGVPLSADQNDVVYLSLGAIMENAEKTGMDVWIGLRQKDSWNNDGWPAIVSSSGSVIQETLDVADALKEKTKLLESKRFAGWYFVPEIDNRKPDGMTVEALGQAGSLMLKELTAKLIAVSNKPIAMSGFFLPGNGNIDEKAFLGLLKGTLRGSGINVFIFQDSVGVRDTPATPTVHLDEHSIKAIAARYASAIDAVGPGIETWPDVELMVGGGNDAPATNINRLIDQLTAAKAFQKIITFAPSHHMTLLGGRQGADQLFKDFYHAVTNQSFMDVPVQGCPALK